MGQKVNPIGMRLQVNRTWDSRWFADSKDYGNLLLEDVKIREFIHEEAKQAGVSRVIIERPHKKCRVTIHSARPGVVIGKKGADIEKLRKDIAAKVEGEVHLNIVEVRKPETDAQLIAENFRDGIPVIINLSQMSDADARRLIDFASGLSLGLYGRIERVTSKVFLLSPENVAVSGDGAVAQADPDSVPFPQN